MVEVKVAARIANPSGCRRVISYSLLHFGFVLHANRTCKLVVNMQLLQRELCTLDTFPHAKGDCNVICCLYLQEPYLYSNKKPSCSTIHEVQHYNNGTEPCASSRGLRPKISGAKEAHAVGMELQLAIL